MEETTKEPTALQQVLRKLGHKNGVVEETIRRLKERGIIISTSGMYQVLNGRSSRPELIETFLEVAEEVKARQQHLQERARQFIAES